jgi:hypothetical protein
LIKYIKSVLWRVAKGPSYIQDARCLTVKLEGQCGALLRKYAHITRLHDATCQNTAVVIFKAVTCLNSLQITEFYTLSLVILPNGLYPSPSEYIVISTTIFNSHCNVILPSTTRSSNWFSLCSFTDYDFMLFIFTIRATYPACLIHLVSNILC